MNFFDPNSVSATHQRALLVEKQLSQRSASGLSIGTGGNTGEVNCAASSSVRVNVQVVVDRVSVLPFMCHNQVGCHVVE